MVDITGSGAPGLPHPEARSPARTHHPGLLQRGGRGAGPLLRVRDGGGGGPEAQPPVAGHRHHPPGRGPDEVPPEDHVRPGRRGQDYRVVGEPQDVGGARALFEQDPFQFQFWAVSLLEAQPQDQQRRGADRGIDGLFYFIDGQRRTSQKVVVQVKGGGDPGTGHPRPEGSGGAGEGGPGPVHLPYRNPPVPCGRRKPPAASTAPTCGSATTRKSRSAPSANCWTGRGSTCPRACPPTSPPPASAPPRGSSGRWRNWRGKWGFSNPRMFTNDCRQETRGLKVGCCGFCYNEINKSCRNSARQPPPVAPLLNTDFAQ